MFPGSKEKTMLYIYILYTNAYKMFIKNIFLHKGSNSHRSFWFEWERMLFIGKRKEV